jgi:ribokinase
VSVRRVLRASAYRRLVGVGGIGTGIFLAVEGERTLGRNESRAARLLDVRDYCKLHIVAHHVAILCGASPTREPFHVVPIGAVGADEAGRRLLAEMAAVGIDTAHVREVPDRPTLFSVCFQYPDGSGGNLTTVDSAAATLTEADVERAADLLDPRTIAVAMPEVDLAPRRRLLELAAAAGAFRAGSFTSAELAEADGLLGLLDLLALNEDEAAVLAERRLDPADPTPFLEALGRAVADAGPVPRLLVTAGAHGAFACERGAWAHRPALPAPVRSTAGAGDALLGAVLAALAAGVPLLATGDAPAALRSGLDLGVALAALAVTSPHTIHPEADLDAVLAFAREAGLAPAPPLSEVIRPSDA